MRASNNGPIPQARERLQYILDRLPSDAGYVLKRGDMGIGVAELDSVLREALGLMHRKPPIRVARSKRPQPTAETCALIRAYAAANPDAAQQDIANKYNTNAGRVSEALNYLR